jgi:ABC-type phosphate/phosphonate transport system substrate-binding protein
MNFFFRSILTFVVLVWSLSVTAQAMEKPLTLGVLSWTGAYRGVQQWTATGEYLSEQLQRPVEILPLEFKDVLPAIEKEALDFFIVEPSLFTTSKIEFGAEAVLTIKSHQETEFFGAVIFTSSTTREIGSLHDLHQRRIGALRRWSFAGWQMAEKEFQDAGIDIYNYVAVIRFFDNPYAVIKAVQQRQIDAGTVPTGFLEEMVEQGAVRMEEFRILAAKEHPHFPLVTSTPLYPGWALGRTAAADPHVAEQMAEALKALPAGHQVLETSRVSAWLDPLDYSAVEAAHQQLRGGAYAGNNR